VFDCGTELHSLDPLTVWNHKSIEVHKRRAIAVLEAEDIDVLRFFKESPHGSLLRDYVINYLDHALDSHLGLAARIVELCCHLQAYWVLPGGERKIPGMIAHLSYLVTLSTVYEIADRPRITGGKEAAKVRKANAKDRHDQIIGLANELLASGKDRRTIAGIIAARIDLSDRQIRAILKGAGI
jgi:hypothetical protein